jgi:hypothetical protein
MERGKAERHADKHTHTHTHTHTLTHMHTMAARVKGRYTDSNASACMHSGIPYTIMQPCMRVRTRKMSSLQELS